MGFAEWFKGIDWSSVLTYFAKSLPYIVAATALVQAWAALGSARSAKRQVEAAMHQVEALRDQVAVEAEVAMVDLRPNFSVTAIGRGELGTEPPMKRSESVFVPLDDDTRLRPEMWIRRRTIEVQCDVAPGPLIAAFETAPDRVQCLVPVSNPQNVGSISRGDVLIPNAIDDSKARLIVTSYMASNPARSWKQELVCFPVDY
jgi:hypothetical protein